MKIRVALLVLLTLILCTFAAFAAGSAPSPSSTVVQAAPAVVSAPAADRADFLASLSASPAESQSTAPSGLTPAPIFMSGCTSSAQCPAGQICCLACGYADCDRHACFATKTCPHFQ
jgi:hypothetical protein